MKKLFVFLFSILILISVASFFSPQSLATCPSGQAYNGSCPANTQQGGSAGVDTGNGYQICYYCVAKAGNSPTPTTAPPVTCASKGTATQPAKCFGGYSCGNNYDQVGGTGQYGCTNGVCCKQNAATPQCSITWPSNFPSSVVLNSSTAVTVKFSSNVGYAAKYVYVDSLTLDHFLRADNASDTDTSFTIHPGIFNTGSGNGTGDQPVPVGTHTLRATVDTSGGTTIECTPTKSYSIAYLHCDTTVNSCVPVQACNNSNIISNTDCGNQTANPGTLANSVCCKISTPVGGGSRPGSGSTSCDSGNGTCVIATDSGCQSGGIVTDTTACKGTTPVCCLGDHLPNCGDFNSEACAVGNDGFNYCVSGSAPRTMAPRDTVRDGCLVDEMPISNTGYNGIRIAQGAPGNGSEGSYVCCAKPQGSGTACPAGHYACNSNHVCAVVAGCGTNSCTAGDNSTCTTPSNPPSGPAHTKLTIDLGIDAIGHVGDRPNPNTWQPVSGQADTGSNQTPKTNPRPFDVKVDATDFASVPFTFNTTTGIFEGTVDLGTSFAGCTACTITLTTGGHLVRKIPNIKITAKSTTNKIPFVNPTTGPYIITGDIGGDETTGDMNNQLDVLDYQALLSCIKDDAINDFDGQFTCNKLSTYAKYADLDNNGPTNRFDYNLFVREISKFQAGD